MTVYVLIILIITALVAVWNVPMLQRSNVPTPIAPAGVAIALIVHLLNMWLGSWTIATPTSVEWPLFLQWVGPPLYGSDALSIGLGTLCLLLGALALWASADRRDTPAWKQAVSTLVVAVLYSLAYTVDLRFFAVQVLLLAMLVWVLRDDAPAENVQSAASAFSLGLGAVALLAAVLLIGRSTGGEYGIAELPVPTLVVWPLVLLALFVGLWAGWAPFTGWSASGYSGAAAATLSQTLVVGLPITVLILRLEATVTAQVIGPAPESWATFTGALAWGGGLTALVAGAGMATAAGTIRWQPFLSAYTMGLVVWALGLDTSMGRYAALAILFSFGAARITLELASGLKPPTPPAFNPRIASTIAALSLAAVPLTLGFVGIWLLAAALLNAGHAAMVLWLAGAIIVAACGTALHFVRTRSSADDGGNMHNRPRLVASFIVALTVLIGGIAPGLWLPLLAPMAGVQAGADPIAATWSGIETSNRHMTLPTVLLTLAALLLAGVAWLVRWWAKRGVSQTTTLMPTAHKRLEKRERANPTERGHALPAPIPASLPVGWFSLRWLEGWLLRFGALLMSWSVRAGSVLGYLEGRYYLPLALALVLVTALALTR